MKHVYDIEIYEDEKGNSPFAKWLAGVKDLKSRAKLQSRIDRIALGNFGDTKPLKNAKNVYELREHYGPGFRIFYTKVDKTIILLLAGSTKKDQKKTIEKAKEYLADYNRRQNHDKNK